jgi:hypothetical protein
MSTRATEKDPALPPRPPFWFRLSIAAGNLAQLAGLMLGGGLMVGAAHLQAPDAVRVVLMLVGWFAIYICCHAIAHWAVGRLVGIEFQGYGLRGTDHPENYPPGLRQVMSAMPTFTVMTKKASMQQARPFAKAMMFGAGESSTAVCSVLAGYYAWRSGIPGGQILFWVMVAFNLFSTVVTALVPRGDYAKAWRALHSVKE